MTATTIYQQEFLDILFAGRNKDYGAYDLRLRYDRRIRNAITGTAMIALLVIAGYVLGSRTHVPLRHIRNIPEATVQLAALPNVEPEKVAPPPPRPAAPPPARSSVKFVTLTVDRDENVRPDEEPPEIDDIGTKAVGISTAAGDDLNGIAPDLLQTPGTGGVVQLPPPEERETIFRYVEVMPSFPGGEEALIRYLGNHIRYPATAAEAGISGTVYVQFVVDATGSIQQVQLSGARQGAGLDEEALRVVKAMPRWKPGRQNGRPVSVQFNLPISFRLQ